MKFRPYVFLEVAIIAIQIPLSVRAEYLHCYAVAKANLAKGTVLSPGDITMVKTRDSQAIPQGAIWLDENSDLSGFALLRPVANKNAISSYDLFCHNANDLTPKASDPLWLKYTKAAIVTDKRNDFISSNRYEQGVLTELEKMAKSKKRIVFMDDEMWLTDMFYHHNEHALKMKTGHAELRTEIDRAKNGSWQSDDLATIKARQVALNNKMLHESKAAAMRSRRICSVLQQVLPVKGSLVSAWKRFNESDEKELAKVLKDQ